MATLGIIPPLFEPNANVLAGVENLGKGDLVLYIVPSRAQRWLSPRNPAL
jgi:hypothetical protein